MTPGGIRARGPCDVMAVVSHIMPIGGLDFLPVRHQHFAFGLDSEGFTGGEESCRADGGNGLAPMGALFGGGRFGAEGPRSSDIRASAVGLDRSGRCLPPFDGGDGLGEGSEEVGDMLGPGVGGGLAEAVLRATDGPP
jgi:hypothetical protein